MREKSDAAALSSTIGASARFPYCRGSDSAGDYQRHDQVQPRRASASLSERGHSTVMSKDNDKTADWGCSGHEDLPGKVSEC